MDVTYVCFLRLADKAAKPRGRKRPKIDTEDAERLETLEAAGILMEMAGFPVSVAEMAAHKAAAAQ